MLLVGDDRAEVGVVRAGADADSCGAAAQPLDKLVRDARLDQELDAEEQTWPVLLERAVQHVGHDPVEVGVGEDEDRVLAAELEHQRARARGRRCHDRAAGLDRAGEGDAAHQRVADERRARLLAIAGDDVEHARRQAGAQRQLGEAAAR